MKIDYHMHFEHGDYSVQWAKGFFENARRRGIDEIGISEHSHGFIEFKDLYYNDLVLDDSFLGIFQKKWLTKKKFMYHLEDYFKFMEETLPKENLFAKIGIEICNFQNQDEVKKILQPYEKRFDYVIGSVHFLEGWGYDCAATIEEWKKRDLKQIYVDYVEEVKKLCASGIYDVLGHPFNIHLFKFLPDFDETPFFEEVAKAMKKADMVVDINTGTLYRYPIQEISPCENFLRIAREFDLKIITTSDAHEPEDCGRYIDQAITQARRCGYDSVIQFSHRDRKEVRF